MLSDFYGVQASHSGCTSLKHKESYDLVAFVTYHRHRKWPIIVYIDVPVEVQDRPEHPILHLGL